MNQTTEEQKLELAVLPLADGRQIALPLTLLAEVQQVNLAQKSAEDLGSIRWRGHELPVSSLEELCGLPAPAPEQYMTVGIFRASEEAKVPFHAIAFCGLAAHNMLGAEDMAPADVPVEGNFAAAAEVDGSTYLVPDLAALSYKPETLQVH